MTSNGFTMARETIRQALHGAAEIEESARGLRPRRLGRAARLRMADHGALRAADDTAGVRLMLLTAAQSLTLEADISRSADGNAAPAFPAVIIARVDGDEVDRVAVSTGPVRRLRDGVMQEEAGDTLTHEFRLGGDGTRVREVALHLPHTAATLIRSIRLSSPAQAAPGGSSLRWLHHGSSISHGHEANDPLSSWPASAARDLGVELVDLSLAGNAMLDPFVADTIATTAVNLVTLKIGINPVGTAALRPRTLIPAWHGFLDRIRSAHPGVPILLISAISCPIHESVPGPTRLRAGGGHEGTPQPDSPDALTLEMTRAAIEQVAEARHDPLLGVLDGRRLLGPDDAHHLHDDVHPDHDGHALMARRFVHLVTGGDLTASSALRAAQRLTLQKSRG
ncbi:GDSL-type esterase/lipase family protein [Microbacterium sp. ZW T5_56]|uniref:GDSL-type esterase/lipase family protein n=1 Tax=Microbacterium sp. ZW T5_56 TaxID=3378081 RepID=UPI003852C888